MRRNVVLVVSGIREGDRLRTTNYELRMKIKLLLLGVLILILASCGSSQRVGKTGAAKSAQQLVTLSDEQQRKYDYFFLEATRLKGKKEYDAAFDLLKHCLTINPQAASALYEISQY